MVRSACVLLVAVAIALAPASRADAPTSLGWWWSGNIEGLPVQPPPPDVPEGGLYVAGGLSGASGVSALRFTVPEGATDPVLTLRVAAGSGTPVIGACPAAAPAWEPAAGGPWAARPTPDCERASVAAEVAPDGGTIRIPLSALLDGDRLDIVLLPGQDPATGAGATFDTSFEAPSADALTFTEPPPASSPATAPPLASPTTTPAFGSTPPASISPAPVAPPAAFIPADNTSAAPIDPAAVSTPAIGGGETIAATAAPDETDGRIAGVILGVLVAGTWFLMTRTDVGARLTAISGGSTGTVRGIGRFATQRETPPPSL